ncbi:MAG: DUF4347 domain-containing protein [Bacteroidota bacterium]
MNYYSLTVLFSTVLTTILLSFVNSNASHTSTNNNLPTLILLDKQIDGASYLRAHWNAQADDLNWKIIDEEIDVPIDTRGIHIISHARPGQLFINEQWMNSKQIANFLIEKGLSVSKEQYLLIYGCEFAKGANGKRALHELKSLLGGIKIAASDDITGKDGDWDLEVGDHLPVLAIPNYPYNLQTGDGTPSWKAALEGDEQATVHLALFNGNDVESDIHTYNAEADSRLYFAVKEGDDVYLGLNCRGNNGDFDFQVRGPVAGGIAADPLNSTGMESIVFGPSLAIGDGTGLTDSGNGYVTDEAEACNGVNQITGGTTGYDGLQIVDDASAGYYYIEFEKLANNDLTACIFDVSVANSAGVVRTGRLFSYRWSLYNRGTGGAGFSVTDLDFYSYHTRDSTVSFFQMDNVVPGGFQVAVTDHGLADNGNLAVDRKSVPYSTTANDEVPGDFPIFFSEPDECFFPLLMSQPNVVASPIFCDNTTSTVDVALNRSGSALVYLDFNDNGSYEDGTDVIIGDQIFTEGTTSLPWDGNDASGTDVADGTKIPVIIVFRLGETHIPLGDFEANPRGFSGDLIKPTSQASNLSFFWDHSCLPDLTTTDPGDFGSLQNLTAGCTTDMCNTWDPGTNYPASDANQAWVNTWFANTLIFEDEIMVMNDCNECITLVVEASSDNCEINSAQVEVFILGGTGQYTVTGFPSAPITMGVEGQSGAFAEVSTGIFMPGTYTFIATDSENCGDTTDVFIGEDCALPVELTYFDAKEQNCNILLSWRTESEFNNSHFELEYSSNGKEFIPISKIKGAGTSLTPKEYAYDHSSIANVNYYRLKQVDVDGSYEYYETIAVTSSCKPSTPLNVYPNPVSSNQILYFDIDDETAFIKMIDTQGKVVRTINLNGQISNTIGMNISDLSAGHYTIVDASGNTSRFVVTR